MDTQEMMDDMIEIGTKSNSAIGRALSNFRNWGFTFDGVECKSIESVLQSFKFPDIEEQKKTCNMLGYLAKYKGMKSNQWKKKQILYWMGKEYPRRSKEYYELLLRLYLECFTQNDKTKKLLLATGDQQFTHSIGKSDPKDTVLTEYELIALLILVRKELIENRSRRS